MKEPIFRRIKKEELHDLLALYKHLHATDDPLPSHERLAAIWDSIMENPSNNYFIIEVDGKLVSSCVLTIIPNLTRGARPYGLVENVVTHASYRKRGLANMLLKRALQFAWDQRCYKVLLLTGHKDEETLRFYEGASFKPCIKTGFIASPPS